MIIKQKTFIITLFSFNGSTFKIEPSSKFLHSGVYALGNYKNSPFVTGDLLSPSTVDGLKTEILDYEKSKWVRAADYEFSNSERFI